MNRSTHPFEQEEVMAYLDGELTVERATVVAAHLERCAECQALAADLRSVSERLAAWQVEPSPPRLAERLASALEAPRSATAPAAARLPRPERRRPLVRGWVWGLAATAATCMLLTAIAIPNLLRSRIAANQASRMARSDGRPTELPRSQGTVGGVPGGVAGGTLGGLSEIPAENQVETPAGPMIVRTAELTLVCKEFDPAREALERIVHQHQGYTAQLSVSGQAGAGRILTATLRVPAHELDAVVAEVKKLGRVEQESQGGEEVTQQYVDLSARLSNARHTEQRLLEVLHQRTGRMTDILAVEREIARVRGEIETMDARLKNLEKQVRYATLQVRLSEEYRAQLDVPQTPTGIRLRNACIEGYRGVVDSTVGLALFLLSYGPVLLFWFLILFWPLRFAWRYLRRATS
jgi:hypothetical protein